MTLQVWQSKRKLGFETLQNMDLEKYVGACEYSSVLHQMPQNCMKYLHKLDFPESEEEKWKWKYHYKTKHSASFSLSSLFAFCSRIKLLRSSSKISNLFCFLLFAKREQISVLPNRRKFWQTPPLGERDGLIATHPKKNHQTFSLSKYLSIILLLDLPN